MEVLRDEHVDLCLASMPDELVGLLRQYRDELVVAGGLVRACVAGEVPSDVDVFTRGRDLAREAATRLVVEAGRVGVAASSHESSCAVTVRSSRHLPVQFIHRWPFESPEELIGGFDFTISKAAIWSDGMGWCSVADPCFYQDVSMRRLQYAAPERDDEAGDALLRVLKFYRRGYRISLVSLAKVVSRLVAVDRSSEQVGVAALFDKLQAADDGSDVEGLSYFRGVLP